MKKYGMKPIVETPRLILREMTPDDAYFFYALNQNYEVIKYTGDRPFENLATARRFLENYDQYKKYGYGRWAVILRETGEWLGWCGLKYEEEFMHTDIGYRFFQKHWGKGYATESAKASLEYGFGKLGIERIVGRAMKANVPSIRIFKKLGMTFVKDIECDCMPAVLYEVSAPG